MNIGELEQKARSIRATCVQMAYDGEEGHLKGALSCVDILVCLYNRWLRIDKHNPRKSDRDRLFFSKGHSCTALYAVLADCGFVKKEDLFLYAKPNSPFPIHPCNYALPILEISSGSLGHGLGIAAGSLYGLRLDGINARGAVLMSDGECNEGSVWEAAMFAAAQKLDRLLAIVDYNRVQSVGRTDDLMGHTSLEDKFRSFGWAARTVNGNKISEIIANLDQFPFESSKPSALIAQTVAGAGVSFMEDDVLWHYRKPSKEELEKALQELGSKPIHKQ